MIINWLKLYHMQWMFELPYWNNNNQSAMQKFKWFNSHENNEKMVMVTLAYQNITG